jgi:hypothetical protein
MIKANNIEFFANCSDRIRAAIQAEDGIRSYISITEYSIWLKVNTYYKTSEHRDGKYEKNTYLFNRGNETFVEYETLPFICVSELEQGKQRIEVLMKQEGEIRSELSTLRCLIGR